MCKVGEEEMVSTLTAYSATSETTPLPSFSGKSFTTGGISNIIITPTPTWPNASVVIGRL